MIWNPFKKKSWTDLGNDIQHTVVDPVVDAGQKAVDTVTKTTNDVAKTLNKTADQIKAESDKAVNDMNKIVLTASKQTAQGINDAVKGTKWATKEFTGGLNVAGKYCDQGLVKVEQGLVEIGKYLNEYACNIAVGGILTGAFTATLNNPETEAETTAMFAPVSTATAVAMAQGAVKETAIRAVCATASASFVEILWAVPEIKNAIGAKNKDALIGACSFVMQSAIVESPWAWLTPQTASICFAGIVAFIIGDLACDGTLPGGYKV